MAQWWQLETDLISGQFVRVLALEIALKITQNNSMHYLQHFVIWFFFSFD